MPTLEELISKLKNNWKGYTLLALATFIFVLYLSTIPIVSFAYDSLSVVFSVLISLMKLAFVGSGNDPALIVWINTYGFCLIFHGIFDRHVVCVFPSDQKLGL